MGGARGPSGGSASNKNPNKSPNKSPNKNSGKALPYGFLTGAAENTLEVRLKGDSTALTRFVMTLQNKRIPLRGLTLGRDEAGLRLTLLLEGEEEPARRYATLLSGLEDVSGIEASENPIQVALVSFSGGAPGDWRGSAASHGVQAHESGGTVVASGTPGAVEEWIAGLGGVEEAIRLGPAARPENGGV